MRYTPVTVVLSLLALVTASAGYSVSPQPLDPRAAVLVSQGKAALQAGKIEQAIDAFEAALVVAPGNSVILIELAGATSSQGMPGKAIHYYRQVLSADPENLAALSGEGAMLARKGALNKAQANLARLEGLCGASCVETQALSATISTVSSQHVVAAGGQGVNPQVP